MAWIELDLTETTFHAAIPLTKRMIKITGERMRTHGPPTSDSFVVRLFGRCLEALKTGETGQWPSLAQLGPAWRPNVAKFFFSFPMLIANLLRVSDDARCDPRDSALDLRRFLAKVRARRRLGGTEAYRRDTRPC